MNAMKKVLVSILVLATCFMFSATAVAQASNEEAGVRACLEEYMSGDGNRLEKAFHPSASMKFVDHKTGEYKDVPIAEFIARIKANSPQPERKAQIVSLNIEGTAAQAKLTMEFEKIFFYDYMNLLKINGEWKIVSKIFYRKDK